MWHNSSWKANGASGKGFFLLVRHVETNFRFLPLDFVIYLGNLEIICPRGQTTHFWNLESEKMENIWAKWCHWWINELFDFETTLSLEFLLCEIIFLMVLVTFRQVFCSLKSKPFLLIHNLALPVNPLLCKRPQEPDHQSLMHSKLPEMGKQNKIITSHIIVAGKRPTKLNN